jgi:hypothetical protein
MENIFVNYGIPAAFILLILAAAAAIILPLINSFSNPKTLLKSAIGIAVLAVIFLIGWSLSPAEANLQYNVTEGTSKVIGGALTTMYILFGLAILGIILSEINKIVQ